MRLACIDLDGVICDERPTFERSMAEPLPGARAGIQRLIDDGYVIVIHTARSWAEYEMTSRWLYDHEIPYDQLIMGKPQATVVIDDRAVRFDGWEGFS